MLWNFRGESVQVDQLYIYKLFLITDDSLSKTFNHLAFGKQNGTPAHTFAK